MRWLLPALLALSACGRSAAPREESNAGPGISLALARERAQHIRNLRYNLQFSIPSVVSQPVSGRAELRFDLSDASRPLVLDFSPGADAITSFSVDGRPAPLRAVPDHIVIPPDSLKTGENSLEFSFRAGDAPLNRNPEFLYTLFVPARAHLAFPCLDQPDLKARFKLELTVPEDWQAVANGRELSRQASGGQARLQFAETEPISTYLFAFAAGKFSVETAQRSGRMYRMFHRETDAAKTARNVKAVFDLHDAAVRWLQEYTGIPYPFGKFDFVVIPSFQFGGMEHPGAIFYNASSILLDPSATETQMLNRANTISHETSHMWFGDLVTMRWFDDVWMKEVFANFMAGKIVNPSFPAVNHDLRFLASHYPAAYSVDRTEGTHPIRQELDNLDEAGSLYGAIIYDKAPIVMRQLEGILGPAAFRQGLRDYLQRFSFGNASWTDLVRVLDERTPRDLAAWSHAWVEQPGRPSIRTETGSGRIALVQRDSRWTQRLEVLTGTPSGIRRVPVELTEGRVEIPEPAGLQFALPNGAGLGYGNFSLDPASRTYLLAHLPELQDPLERGAAWVTLWEEMLDERIAPPDFLDLALRGLPRETAEQNVQMVLGFAGETFWRFLPEAGRRGRAERLERTLRSGWENAPSRTLKATYFAAFRSLVTTGSGIAFLEQVWRGQEKIPGLPMAEPDEAAMALELAVRSVPAAESILREQLGRFSNPDRRDRFSFVMPALARSQAERDAFFGSLARLENRRHEPWVLEGLSYLNHPLRAEQSRPNLMRGLELLQEIQRTGDIFFPKRWLDALLAGHNSPVAATTVRGFLAGAGDYPGRLRRILLQAADPLFRSSAILYSRGN